MRKFCNVVFLPLVLVSSHLAAAPVTSVDLTKSEIKFISKQMNVPVEGMFKKFDVQFVFDPDKLASSKAQISVDIASIDTGSTEGDAEVARKAWFDTAQFPKATFVSSAVKAIGNGRFEASGKLTIKGRTKDVVAPFTAKAVAGGTLLEGELPMNRKHFAIGEGAWDDPDTVAREVTVKFKFFGRSK